MAKKSRGKAEEAAPPSASSIDDETVAALLARLRRVEGQVRAVARMIEQRRDCHAIAQQMGAAKSALERATIQLMSASMVKCLRPNGKTGEIDQAELDRLTDTFMKILG